MANEYIRKEFGGGAVRTQLNGAITAGTTTIAVLDGSTFPSGTYPFVVVLDRGLATEEKVLLASRTGNNLTVSQRGYDGSASQSHASGAYVDHVLDAYTVEQSNAIATAMTTQGDLVYKTTTGENTLFSRLPIGTSGYPMLSTGTAPSWGQVTAGGIAANAIDSSKIATSVAGAGLSGGAGTPLAVNVDATTIEISGDTLQVKDASITSAKITDGTIVNGDINASAAIVYSKLALTNSIVQADLVSTIKPVVVCTSTTRPTAADGQLIYETDKDRIRVYNATSTVWELVSGQYGATVNGSATIASGGNAVLTYSAETYDPDGLIPASGSTFTFPEAGTYSITIAVSGSASMSAGLGSGLEVIATGKTHWLYPVSTTASLTLVLVIAATNTVQLRMNNATGVSVTYTYETFVRFLGR